MNANGVPALEIGGNWGVLGEISAGMAAGNHCFLRKLERKGQ
jgi:hypothetical protein